MRNIIGILTAALLLAGCSLLQPSALTPNKQAFNGEDAYVLFALDAETNGHYITAAEFYAYLYQKAPRVEYRDRFLTSLSMGKEYDDVLLNVQQLTDQDGFDPVLERFKIRALVGKGALEAAEAEALALLPRTKAKEDYVALAEIYSMQKQYNTALRYLESAYAIDYDEQVLEKLAVMMYVNLDRKTDAIAQLQTHIRLNGCSERICKRLAGFYSDQNDIEGMLATYRRLYDSHPSPAVASTIIRIYSYQNDFVHLKQFLEEYHTDDALLLKLYINAKEYEKATATAQSMYDETGDAGYLGQSAIFLFEGAPDKQDRAMIDTVVRKLKKALRSKGDALMFNYLGYILIDNDVDPEAGIGYIESALELEPDSPYYLDSLAWGYYKVGLCETALSVMLRAKALMDDAYDEEVENHLGAIKACAKEQKK